MTSRDENSIENGERLDKGVIIIVQSRFCSLSIFCNLKVEKSQKSRPKSVLFKGKKKSQASLLFVTNL